MLNDTCKCYNKRAAVIITGSCPYNNQGFCERYWRFLEEKEPGIYLKYKACKEKKK